MASRQRAVRAVKAVLLLARRILPLSPSRLGGGDERMAKDVWAGDGGQWSSVRGGSRRAAKRRKTGSSFPWSCEGVLKEKVDAWCLGLPLPFPGSRDERRRGTCEEAALREPHPHSTLTLPLHTTNDLPPPSPWPPTRPPRWRASCTSPPPPPQMLPTVGPSPNAHGGECQRAPEFAIPQLIARQAEVSQDARQVRGHDDYEQHPHQGRVPGHGPRAPPAGAE